MADRTVAELADALQVSKQTIYRRLRKLKGKHTAQEGGKTYITAEGQQLIADMGMPPPEAVQRPPEATDQVTQDYIATLKAQLEKKDIQIAEQDRHIAEKDRQLEDRGREVADLLKLSTSLTTKLAASISENTMLKEQQQQIELLEAEAISINGQSDNAVKGMEQPKGSLFKRFRGMFNR